MSPICDVEKLCDVIFTNPSNFQSLEAVDSGSETQLQVTENLIEDSVNGLLFKIVHNLDRQTSGFREKNTIAVTSQNVHNSVSQHISS